VHVQVRRRLSKSPTGLYATVVFDTSPSIEVTLRPRGRLCGDQSTRESGRRRWRGGGRRRSVSPDARWPRRGVQGTTCALALIAAPRYFFLPNRDDESRRESALADYEEMIHHFRGSLEEHRSARRRSCEPTEGDRQREREREREREAGIKEKSRANPRSLARTCDCQTRRV